MDAARTGGGILARAALRHDADRGDRAPVRMGESLMPTKPPSQNTQWVAAAMANATLEDLCCNLAAYLAQVPAAALGGEPGEQLVVKLLQNAAGRRGHCRGHRPRRIRVRRQTKRRVLALDMFRSSMKRVRKVALHKF
jgi:hypothetical protein